MLLTVYDYGITLHFYADDLIIQKHQFFSYQCDSGKALDLDHGQVVHMYVPLSPSSIIWSKNGDVLGWEGDHRPGGK